MKRREYSHRKGLFGGYVLLVRTQYFNTIMQGWEWGDWRDATIQDLIDYYKDEK